MLGNEFLFKKPDKFEFTFIEISLFYSTINRTMDVVSGGLGGLKPPNNFDDTKFFM